MSVKRIMLACSLLFALAACSGTPQKTAGGKISPPGVKVGKPYVIEGETYYPEYDPHYDRTGTASWYGPGFHGGKTANGETFDQHDLTAAHPTLPMPSLVRVTNLDNGKSAIVRINDRGPFKSKRIIDLSRASAQALDIQGLGKVRVQYLKEETEQFWADHELSTKDIQFAKNDPNAPANKGYDGVKVPKDEQVAQNRPSAPVMSVAATDLGSGQEQQTPQIRPLKPTFKVIGDAQAADDPPEEEVAEQKVPAGNKANEDEDGGPQAVHLFKSDGIPVSSLTAPGKTKVVQIKQPEPFKMASADPPPAIKNAAPSSGGIFIQAGSFSSEGNAQNLADRLKLVGEPHVAQINTGEKIWHRVRVGPFRNRKEAERALTTISDEIGVADAHIVGQ